MGMFNFTNYRFDNRFRLILVAIVVGLAAGFAAVLLNTGLHWASEFLSPHRSSYYSVLLPIIGILLSVFLTRKIFRENHSHGVPEVIHAISKRGGRLSFRLFFSRLIGCLLTLSGGGSAGPEAPIVVSGASLGSQIAHRFKLKDRQRTVMVGCGTSASIASIFNAPATGIMFTMEIILGEWTQLNLVPIAIASVVGCQISRLFRGNQIPFEHRNIEVSYLDLATCVFLALAAAIGAVIFIRILRRVGTLMESKLNSIWLRAIVGGILVGIAGLFFPDVSGEGYRSIRDILENVYRPGMLVLGSVILVKIAATSITLGAGGVGGVFAPCLVIGAMVGLLFHNAAVLLFPTAVFAEQGYYALIGMAGMVSGVLKAPLTGIFLIMEITGGYDVLASVVLVSVLSSTLSSFFEPLSLYHRDLFDKGLLLRARTDARVLSEIRIVELLELDCMIVQSNMKLGEFVRMVAKSSRNHFPVENSNNEYLGMVKLESIRPFLFDRKLYDTVLVEEFMETDVPIINQDESLTDVMEIMDRSGAFSLPVVENGRFIGLISKGTLLDRYRREMAAQEEI